MAEAQVRSLRHYGSFSLSIYHECIMMQLDLVYILQWNTDCRTTIFPLKSSKIRKKVGPGICWSETLLAGKSWSESYECRRLAGPRELIPKWWNSRNYRQIWVFLFVIYSWSQCPIWMKLSESTYQTFLLVLQSQYRTKFAWYTLNTRKYFTEKF